MVALLAELDLQLLNFVVVEILLDQVALSLYSCPDIRGNVWNQPGHEVFDHKHDMLWKKKKGTTDSTVLPALNMFSKNYPESYE